ncbi:MAG: hypothetical protein IKO52_05380 [Clostridia bacterium]|nr:hypothetical protein [Clostridia bacterium]
MKQIFGFLRRDKTPLLLIVAMAALWAALCLITNKSFAGPTAYNTYTRQAMAWRDGLLHLPYDVSYLELAVYQGDYYVSFPPLPSVVLLPLTYLFGWDTPDNLLVKLYALGACLLMYEALKHRGYKKWEAGIFSFLFCFASSLLPLTLDGAVWYHAQVLAFFLTTAAVCFLSLDRPTLALIGYALAVGCRPFNALYGLPLFAAYLAANRREGKNVKSMARALLPGVCLGICVAFGLGLYNYVRFGDPLEFGHNYLPEFSTQGGIQFSVDHVAKNLKTFLWGLPLNSDLEFQKFGFSMLIACPTLVLMLYWFIVDLFRRRMRAEKAVVLLACVAHAFLLLMHRTFGGYQLGARYAVDLVPYTFFYLLLTPEKKRPGIVEYVVLAAVFAFMVWGTIQVHL